MFIFFKCPGNVGMQPQHAEKLQSNRWTLHSQILSMWDTCVNLHPARHPLKSFLNHFIRGPALFPLAHHASIYFWMNEWINIWYIIYLFFLPYTGASNIRSIQFLKYILEIDRSKNVLTLMNQWWNSTTEHLITTVFPPMAWHKTRAQTEQSNV